MPSADTTTTFEIHRSLLFSIAYRMTGSVMDAEDMVQETYLRYLAADAPKNANAIDAPKAYLCKITTNLCLDHLKSARVQRESYIGPWLPEPLLTADAPPDLLMRKEMLSMAFLVMLENLQPLERAVFLLRESFGYGYGEIAQIVEKSEANCRQIFSRAKKALPQEQPVFESDPRVQQQTVKSFLFAVLNGNNETVQAMVADEVVWWSDGGGKVTAATKPIYGRDKVLAFIEGLMRVRQPNMVAELGETNGYPSVLIWAGDELDSVINCIVEEGQVVGIYAVRNPDKLHHIARDGKPHPIRKFLYRITGVLYSKIRELPFFRSAS